jgi:hypothetical protein
MSGTEMRDWANLVSSLRSKLSGLTGGTRCGTSRSQKLRVCPGVERLEAISLLSTISVSPNQIQHLLKWKDSKNITTDGGNQYIAVWEDRGSEMRGFFDFSSVQFSEIPQGSKINSAKLTFDKVVGQHSLGGPFQTTKIDVVGLPSHNHEFTIQPSGPWSVFGNDDFSGGSVIRSFQTDAATSDGQKDGVYPVDVTDYVKQSLDSDKTLHMIGFRLDASAGGFFVPGGNGANGNGFDSIHLTIDYEEAAAKPVIKPTALDWLSDGSGISLDYTVSGNLPPGKDPKIALVWSDQDSFRSDAPRTNGVVHVAQTHQGPETVSMSTLGTPPSWARYLLAVADPDHEVTDPNGFVNYASIPYAPLQTDIDVHYAAWAAPTDLVSVSYSIVGAPLAANLPVKMSLYWSKSTTYDSRIITNPQGTPAAELSVVLDKAPGSHVVTFRLADMGPVPSNAQYLLAIANPPVIPTLHGLIAETREDNNSLSMPIQRHTLAWGQKVSPGFRQKAVQIADELQIDPNFLMSAMAFETGESFNPAQPNIQKVWYTKKKDNGKIVKEKHVKYGVARGLIQFMPDTAEELGTTSAELEKMTAEQQLEYVRDYLKPNAGQLHSVDDVYMKILWPKGIGKPSDYVLFDSKGNKKDRTRYDQNKGLDADHDGKITKAEASAQVRAKLIKGLDPTNATQHITILPAGTPPTPKPASNTGGGLKGS